jgi:hypothetical protein
MVLIALSALLPGRRQAATVGSRGGRVPGQAGALFLWAVLWASFIVTRHLGS